MQPLKLISCEQDLPEKYSVNNLTITTPAIVVYQYESCLSTVSMRIHDC